MLTETENDLLCRVEGDAPMGQIMRSHWMPACLSEELPEADGAPIALRLLGEDLVGFRDTGGRVGVLERYCPHRRASLVFGRNEDHGLRCLYHGWKMDVGGLVTEMPSEPQGACAERNVQHKAYPTQEYGGFVWVFMGAPADVPAFQPPAWAPTPDTRVSVAKVMVDCNWAQVLEGNIDSAHSSSLHSSEIRPGNVTRSVSGNGTTQRPSTDKAPRIQVDRTPYGFRYAALRRPIRDADNYDYVRVTAFIAPYTVLVPPNSAFNIASLSVPVDDTHTAFYFICWAEEPHRGLSQEQWRQRTGTQVQIDVDRQFRKLRRADNGYLQDRAAMKLGNFTGIRGIPNQDIAMWETMGPMADRTVELLGASDVAIVHFRRLMVDAARAKAAGEPAIGAGPPAIAQAPIRSFEGLVAKTADWRSLTAGV